MYPFQNRRWDSDFLTLKKLLDLPADGVEELVAERCSDDLFDCSALQALADAYRRWGAKSGEAFIAEIERQFEQDVPIWENKAHLERPLLVEGESGIALVRRWARQFYSR